MSSQSEGNNLNSTIPLKTELNINESNNNNNLYQPLEPNIFTSKRKSGFYTEKNSRVKNKNNVHPLDFYALGKVDNPPIYSPFLCNRGIKSSSNNIIQRNSLSLNVSRIDFGIKTKETEKISNKNITDNNYMNPIKIFKTFEEYNIPKYATNYETYNIKKEKLFSKDIPISKVSKGKNISMNDFINQKNKLISERGNNSFDNVFYKTNGFPQLKDINIDKVFNVKKTTCLIKPFTKSSSESKLVYNDPIDHTKTHLKSNIFYFNKNSNQMLKNKNWWKGDK